MDPAATTAITKAATPALAILAKELAPVLRRAVGASQLEQRVVLYLRVAQESVDGLARERQQILREASLCNVRKASEVEALWKRMYVYLHEDNIRVPFQKAVDGLHGCDASITEQAQKFSWRGKQTKQAAAEAFRHTRSELERVLQRLKNTVSPWGSGMGVRALGPIYDLLSDLRHDRNRKTDANYDAASEKLGELIHHALRHASNDDWLAVSGQVERLVTELNLAFHWREDLKGRAASLPPARIRGGSSQAARQAKTASKRA